MSEINESLATAFDRVADFQAVQAGASCDELAEAVSLLQESVGITEDERILLRERLDEIRGTKPAKGSVLLGLILGLMAAEET
ncbi:MAG: hypothetical protein ACR2G3_11690 [Solirubrobacterales bacterium]